MLNSGRVCVKTAGREAGSVCVVLERVNDFQVVIEGMVKKRKCNVKHLEPLPKTVKVTKSSSKKEVLDSLTSLGLISKEESEKFLNKKPKEVKGKPSKKVKEKKAKKIKKKEVKKKEVKKEPEKKKAPVKKKASKK